MAMEAGSPAFSIARSGSPSPSRSAISWDSGSGAAGAEVVGIGDFGHVEAAVGVQRHDLAVGGSRNFMV
jgi:hypothetical protein